MPLAGGAIFSENLCHICCLRPYPDYKHRLCAYCQSINSRWPPPPKDPPPPEKNPDLIYAGDIDPEFKPSRGDILVVNPAIGPSLRKLSFKGSCVLCYDGSPDFQFVRGDVLVRIGDYEVQIVEPPPKVEDKKGKGPIPKAKAAAVKKDEKVDKKLGAKGAAKSAQLAKGEKFDADKPPEPDKPLALVTYKPYERLEVYYYTGDEGVWRFLGTQANLDLKNKVLLETQCPGLTAFYKYYKCGTKVLPHTLVPFLGEILLPEWIWQEEFDHKANKWRSSGRWCRPDVPEKEKLRTGMILLRPLVGQRRGDGPVLLNTVQMARVKRLEEEKAKEIQERELLEKFVAMEKANAAPAADEKEKDDKKGKKGKKDDKDDKKSDKKSKKDDKEKKKDDGKGKKADDAKDEKKKGGKKDDPKDAKKKGGKEETRKEEAIPEVPAPPNNDEILKLARWGAVEMYQLEGEEQAPGWVFYGRSDRICDTAYPMPSETTKRKFVHEDDRGLIIEPPVEEPPPEPEVEDKKGKKGKKDDKKKKGDKGDKGAKDQKADKKDKDEAGDKKKKKPKN
ncbi:hypothetical protein AXG93_2175s1210 [Marchantia polymorpha subsp. ruderalis]|uniref:Uncharacterized protein n=1 Tax=Marchantia polymorpha subsp. ruderalis TaxID=1480154 RepID=A0A176W630_MARPO|nr:hypothetical protein AXG93_2175s1210 [Marchantia polymorpha subsp. ruderalis]